MNSLPGVVNGRKLPAKKGKLCSPYLGVSNLSLQLFTKMEAVKTTSALTKWCRNKVNPRPKEEVPKEPERVKK